MTKAKSKSTKLVFVAVVFVIIVGGVWVGYTFLLQPFLEVPLQYVAVGQEMMVEIEKDVVSHKLTPASVRAVYMTSWVAGTPSIRERLIKLIEATELNAVVIDIKDYSGRIAFATTDPELVATGAVEVRIPAVKELISDLHRRGVYVIGRVSVFQDVYYANQHPEFAVHRSSDGEVWRDRKGISWLEVGATPVWAYVVRIARAAYDVGFDEINFDYIRFPSDGDMRDIGYDYFDAASETRAAVLKRFYAYLAAELSPLHIPISADLFGLTTTSFDDLGIGQVLVDVAPYFDYLSPLVYPSHFASGFLNFPNPANHPYEVVKNAMTSAVA